MNTPQAGSAIPWIDANQTLLSAEFARLGLRLGSSGDAVAIDRKLASARAAMPMPAAIDQMCLCFDLSAFERDLLLLCAGVEMDDRLAAQCAAASQGARGVASGLSDGTLPAAFTHAYPSFSLAMALLEAPHWSALAPVHPLRRWRLLELDDAGGITRGRLRIDERILHYLAGLNYLDVRLASLVRPAPLPVLMGERHQATGDAVCSELERHGGGPIPVVWLVGDDAAGQADVAAEVADSLGLVLHVVRAEDVPADHAELEAFCTLWQREAVLLGGALLLACGEGGAPDPACRLAERLACLTFIGAAQPQVLDCPALRFAVDKPDVPDQKLLWQQALGDQDSASLHAVLDGIATQFRLSARTIAELARHSGPALATEREPERALWSACRTTAGSRLSELAQRVTGCADWDDLILPGAQTGILRQIAVHVRHRLKVYVEWGFAGKSARGLGVTALFSGESGAGKTMAAEVLANELQLDLYRIDLSAVVSKYIGETEKNIRRVFDAAEESGAILLFDEADALFGKRSEVKDSHDRYANVEVSYLLQRMETYRGLAILTSNLKAALDVAFQRRLRFVVQFPFPDEASREAIWRRAFPVQVPVGEVDYGKLSRLVVTGGNIRNIALQAAFLAAESGQPVSMRGLLEAARYEASKRERPLADAETRGWA